MCYLYYYINVLLVSPSYLSFYCLHSTLLLKLIIYFHSKFKFLLCDVQKQYCHSACFFCQLNFNMFSQLFTLKLLLFLVSKTTFLLIWADRGNWNHLRQAVALTMSSSSLIYIFNVRIRFQVCFKFLNVFSFLICNFFNNVSYS